jgi:hypothetical protein
MSKPFRIASGVLSAVILMGFIFNRGTASAFEIVGSGIVFVALVLLAVTGRQE